MIQNNRESMDLLIDNKTLIVYHLLVAIEDLADEDVQFPKTETISNLAFTARQILMLKNEEDNNEHK